MSIDISKLETRLFINGEFVNSVSGKTFPTVNPATEEVICQVQEADEADVNLAVDAACAAFALGSPWRKMNPSGRRDLLNKLVDLIVRDREYLEQLEALDNGKPQKQNGWYGTETDLHLVISCLRYYAGACPPPPPSLSPSHLHRFFLPFIQAGLTRLRAKPSPSTAISCP